VTAAALTVIGLVTAAGLFSAWQLDRAGSAVVAAAVAEPQPVPVPHIGATMDGLLLAPAVEELDPFDPRWRPAVGWDPPLLFATTIVERAGLADHLVGEDTRALILSEVRRKVGAR